MITQTTIDRVFNAADIVDVVGDFVQLRREGANFVGLCPFHQDSKPSLKVNRRLNICKCFVCGGGGSPVNFLMAHQNMTYPQAIEWLAKKYGIEMRFDRREQTPQEEAEYKHRESLYATLSMVQRFFVEQLQAETPEAAHAREYAYSRWPKDFCDDVGIGYAPKDSRIFLEWMQRHGVSEDALKELGQIGISEERGVKYAQFRDRVTIPIAEKWGKICGFTARYIGNNDEIAKSRKYINSSASVVFQKDNNLFGIYAAKRQAQFSNGYIMVEGAPDALRLQSLGLTEVVAPLGTALTEKQLVLMRQTCKVVRFIPDSDPKGDKAHGAGVLAVMKSGELAMRNGFEVYVKEIPRSPEDDAQGIKRDPDSYITSREIYSSLESVPFPVWVGTKKFPGLTSPDEKIALMQEIASLLILIEDDDMRDYCIDELKDLYGKKKMWTDAIKRAGRKMQEEEMESDNGDFSQKEIAAMRKLGIIVRNNCYYSTDKEGSLVRWSNFILRPVFHIKHKENAMRAFRMINEYGEEDALEIPQKEFTTVGPFNTAVESLGGYIFIAKQEQFNKVKEYLYAATESAEEIRTLGWQKNYGFFAFANGIYANGSFLPIDAHGIVRWGGKTFYLAPFSEMYKEEEGAFQFERIFVYKNGIELSFHDYTKLMIDAFGDKAKIAVAWSMACMFRDIIYPVKDSFPMLNLYGIKGSGKTAFARIIASLFYVLDHDPPKLSNTTVPAFSYIVSHVRNAPYILDEYTNLLDEKHIEALKGIWGGTIGMKMDTKSARGGISTTKVHAGIIFGGQHKPDIDAALISRVIHLYFPSAKFSPESRLAFKTLRPIAKQGGAHFSMEIMRHREHFAKNYEAVFDIVKDEVIARIGDDFEERLLEDWIMLLATVRVLETLVRLPFGYADFFDVVANGIRYQQKEMDKSSETNTFWTWLNAMHMVGKVVDKTHYVIKSLSSFQPLGSDITRRFGQSKRLLFLNWIGVRGLLHIIPNGNKMKMDASALENYLQSCPYYLGIKQQRYTVLLTNGTPDYTIIPGKFTGTTERKVKKSGTKAFVFDYDMLKEQCNVDLETILADENEIEIDEPEEEPIEETPAPPKPQSLFEPPDDEDAPF